MTSVEHVTLDGSVVSLTGDLDLSEPATSVGVLLLSGQQVEFTAGKRELGELAYGLVFGVSDFKENYSLQGGTLRVGHNQIFDGDLDTTVDVWVGVWEGADCCLFAHVYGGNESGRLIDLFGRLEIGEGAAGLTANPKENSGVYFESPPEILKLAPGVGMMFVQRLTSELIASLPTANGTVVAGGELYYDDVGAPHFLLVTDKALATVSVAEDPDKAAAAMETLIVEWADPV